MRRIAKYALSVAFILATHPSAWSSEVKSRCYIQFFATSTLHDFSGRVTSEPFTLRIIENEGKGRFVGPVSIDVPVNDMKTGKEKRDRKMREMFQSERFPSITGSISGFDPHNLRERLFESDGGETDLSLSITIRNITRELQAMVYNYREYGEQISFDLKFPLSLQEFGLKPPSTFLGIVRVGDEVSVRASFNIEVKPEDLFSNRKGQRTGKNDSLDTQH